MKTTRRLGIVLLLFCGLTAARCPAAIEPSGGAEAEVRAAVDSLVRAFAEGRLDDYFESFTADCSFMFYTTPGRLESVQAYRDVWKQWVAADAFKVISCSTTNTRVQVFTEFAVVTHDVSTRVSIGGKVQDLQERETIVLRKIDGRWLGVHEHLSPAPSGG